MLAGDITGKMIVPIVKQPDGTYLSSYAGWDIRCKSESEVQDLEKSIRDSGYYAYLTEPDEMASLEADKNKVNQLFTKLMVDTVVRWVQMAEERLRDPAPKLDETFKPVLSGGQMVMAPAGSIAVRDAIKKYQPLAGFHGHIHESKGVASIGRTKCFNPGSEYGEGVLRGLLVDLTENGIKSYLFTSG
jgi:hypothetical protein